jgi:hypothetical protein
VFAFLAEHRHELFPDSFIADLFSSSTGRPSPPADLIGSVPQLVEALRRHAHPGPTSDTKNVGAAA